MKKLLQLILFTLITVSALGQAGSPAVGGVFYRVTDSTTYRADAQLIARHGLGYSDITFNAQATTPHWDIWNGSSYDHVSTFPWAGGSGGGVGLVDGDYGDITVGGTGTTMTVDNGAITSVKLATNIRTKDFPFSVTDEVIPISVGTGILTFRAPRAMTLTGIRASLNVAQASGSIVTVDVLEGGVSILSTLITFDNTETTTVTAAAPPVISDTSIADNAIVYVSITQADAATAAAGLKITLYYVD